VVEFLLGFATALVPVAILCERLDRRSAQRYRIARRVDQIPQPLPGAYEPPAGRALTRTHPGVVIDVATRED
jgi:hypothetical protein